MTTQNEAAERLRDVSLPEDSPYADEGWYASGWNDAHIKIKQNLDDALAAERRATVERIHSRLVARYMGGNDSAAAFPLNEVFAILDQEAAR